MIDLESRLFPGRWLSYEKRVIERDSAPLRTETLVNGIRVGFYGSDPYSKAVFMNGERAILLENCIVDEDVWLGALSLDAAFLNYLTTL